MRAKKARALRKLAAQLTTSNRGVIISPRRRWPSGTFRRIYRDLKKNGEMPMYGKAE